MTSTTQHAAFNLVRDGWISVERLDGSMADLGLRDLLAEAHTIRRISGDLPSQDFAILRLVLAVLYRSLDPVPQAKPIVAWTKLAADETLPMGPIDRYLDTWQERFDLGGPTPFFQTADLRNSSDDWRPLSLVVPDSNPDGGLFSMRSEIDSISLAEAARWLVHCHAYDPSGIKMGPVGDPRTKGGRGYPIGIGWCGWLGGTWVEGDNLKETLLLNLVLDRQPRSRNDVPVWEEEPLPVGERDVTKRGPYGQVGLLTWPQRRIRLQIEGDRVTAVRVANGDPIDYVTQNNNELMTPWRFSEPQTTKAKAVRYMPRVLSSDRAAWRGLSTLLPGGTVEQRKTKFGSVNVSEPAGVLAWIGRLLGEQALDADKLLGIRVVSFEYGTQSASYAQLVSEELRFVAGLASLTSERLRATAIEAAQRAEQAARVTGTLANRIAQAAGGEPGAAGSRAEGELFAEFDRSFPQWLASLRMEDAPDVALARWSAIVRRGAEALADRLIAAAPLSAWAGRVVSEKSRDNKRVVSVGIEARWFRRNLAKALGEVSEVSDDAHESATGNEEHGDV